MYDIVRKASSLGFLVLVGVVIVLAVDTRLLACPNIWTATLGVVCVAIGTLFAKAAEPFDEVLLNNQDYFLSTRPVQNKIGRMAPGFKLNTLAMAFWLLGAALLLEQGVVFVF